jgi:hypothetical protein
MARMPTDHNDLNTLATSWTEAVCLHAAHNYDSRRTHQAKPGTVSRPGANGAIHEFQFPE